MDADDAATAYENELLTVRGRAEGRTAVRLVQRRAWGEGVAPIAEVNGRLRGQIELPRDASQDEALAAAVPEPAEPVKERARRPGAVPSV